jgi:hypothetical protein
VPLLVLKSGMEMVDAAADASSIEADTASKADGGVGVVLT